MKKHTSYLQLFSLIFGLTLTASPAVASIALKEPKDVMCGKVKCGTLEIEKYEKLPGNATQAVAGSLGIDIEALFKPVAGLAIKSFHYIQAITEYNSTDRRWINDTSVAIGVPFVDTPPGGYKIKETWNSANWTDGQPFDYKLYYDEPNDTVKFPGFSDTPGMYMLPAKVNKLVFNFETWLICTIDEIFGANPNTAKDDNYSVAPLLGFTWGFNLVYNDQGVLGTDELNDFSVVLKDSAWIMAPSNDWKNSLTTKYGAGDKQDFFNAKLGACEECKKVPPPPAEVPAPLPILGIGVALRYTRRMKSMSNEIKAGGSF